MKKSEWLLLIVILSFSIMVGGTASGQPQLGSQEQAGQPTAEPLLGQLRGAAAAEFRVLTIPKEPPSTSVLRLDPSLAPKELLLTMEEAVYLALEDNPSVDVSRVQTNIQESNIMGEKGAFDPSYFMWLKFEDRTDPLPIRARLAIGDLGQTFTSIDSETVDFGSGFRGKLVTGGQYDLFIQRQRIAGTLDSAAGVGREYYAQLAFRLTQPLLRDFGISTNTTQIKVASNNKEISLYQFKELLTDTLANVKNAYWDLVFAKEELEVKKQSLKLAESLLKETKIKVEVGVLPKLEQVQAEAGVALREEDVILAQKDVEDKEDALFLFLDSTADFKTLDIDIIPVDSPQILIETFDPQESLEKAFSNRPDLAQQILDGKNSELQMRFAKNQLLPTLDLQGQYGFQGVQNDLEDTVDTVFRGKDEYWILGIFFEVPLGNRTAKGSYDRARFEAQKAQYRVRNIKYKIVAEVQEAIRRVKSSLERIEATKQARIAAEKALDAEEKKFRAGVSTSHDVLEIQDDLAMASRDEIRALIDYNKSLVNIAKVRGDLLEQHAIIISDFQQTSESSS